MNDKVNILGVNVDVLTMDKAVEQVSGFLVSDQPNTIFTPNSEILLMAYKDQKFADILNSASMLTADGIGVVYASRIVKKPVPERVPGYDLACKSLELGAKAGKSVFIFGAKPGVAELAAEKIKNEYPGIKIAGTRNGYFKDDDTPQIIEEINRSGADMLLVGLSAPKQELWIHNNKNTLKPKVIMGIGGTIDGLAGVVERAPEAWQKAGLEWLFRLIKEPKRIWRMTALPRFGLTVLFFGKRYKKQ